MLSSARRAILQSHVVARARLRASPVSAASHPSPLPWARARYTTTTAPTTPTKKQHSFGDRIKQLDQRGQSAMTRKEIVSLLGQARSAPEKETASALTLAKWFYQPHTGGHLLSRTLLNDIGIWKEAFKLGYNLSSKGHRNVLAMLVSAFNKRFPTDTIADSEAVTLLIRAYGILGRRAGIDEVMAAQQGSGSRLDAAALLAYADCGANAQFNALLETTTYKLSHDDYEKLAWKFSHQGDVARTQAMLGSCAAPPEARELILLNAHKAMVHNVMHERVATHGVYGRVLSKTEDPVFDGSWEALTGEIKSLDEARCNLILDYLCTANLLDSARFPMARAEAFLREMTARGVTPSARTYGIVLNGYSRTQEYTDEVGHNTRLDKALQLFEEMKDVQLEYRRTFHALLRACVPHQGQQYAFDYVQVASNAEGFVPRMRLDPRFFQIERIMLDAHVRYDKHSILTALTCLGAAHQYPAMWRRWHMLKLSGVRRSQTAFRLAFSLAAMQRDASQYALSVLKEELVREMPVDKPLNLDLYRAMLNCCVTAKDARVAKQILGTMAQHFSDATATSNATTTAYVQSVLRTATLLDDLESEGRAALQLLDKTQPAQSNRAWFWALAFQATHSSDPATRIQDVQQTFTRYTMQRFQSGGKIPIPVRDASPVVPFPSGPYSFLDIRMINMYVHSLVDSQNASLLVDVLSTFKAQKAPSQHLNARAQRAVRQLLEQEQNDNIDAILQDL